MSPETSANTSKIDDFPTNVDAERAVLGALVAEPQRIHELTLAVDHFSLDFHRQLFQAMNEFAGEGSPTGDPVLLAQRAGFGVAELAAMYDLQTQAVTCQDLARLATLIRMAAAKRYAANVGEAIALAAQTGATPAELLQRLTDAAEGLAEYDIDRVDGLVVECAAAVRPERIGWLVPHQVPLGKLTAYAGDPDLGKSLATVDLAARASTGREWPDGSRNATGPVNVLMLIGEDGYADTVVPRLMAAGADLSRIHFIKSARNDERPFELDQDMDSLRQHLKSHPTVKLIIVDPMSSHLGAANMNREQELRRMVLTPLRNLAEEYGCAIVGVSHFNKAKDVSAIHKTGGAVAMVGVARMVWGFFKSTEDPELRLMLRIKGNIAKDTGGMQYKAEEKHVVIDGKAEAVPVVHWMGKSTARSDEVLAENSDPEATKVNRAARWLTEYIAGKGGRVAASDAYAAAERAGVKFLNS